MYIRYNTIPILHTGSNMFATVLKESSESKFSKYLSGVKMRLFNTFVYVDVYIGCIYFSNIYIY